MADPFLNEDRKPPGSGAVSPAEPGGPRRTKPSLRRTEDLFRLLVEGVIDYAIFMLDPTGRVVTWNLGAERLKGYRAEEIIGQHFSTFYRQEDIARGWPEYELQVAAAEGRFEDEGWRLRKDGSLFWANVVITALYDRGRLCGFSKVTRDLTERKRAEGELRQARDLLEQRVEERTAELMRANSRLQSEIEERRLAEQALREGEQRLRCLMELMPAAVYVCEAPSGVIRYFNRCAAELWGREPKIGDTDERFCGAFRLFWPDGTPLPHIATPMAQVLAGASPVRGQRVVIERPDGSRILVMVNIDPITNLAGQVVGAINVFQDVTERERLFEELRQSEERFRHLVFALPTAVYTTDREGRITLFNDHAVELWGQRPEIGKDRWCGSYRIFRPDGTPRPLDECPMAVTLREERPLRGEEIIVERPDGSRACILPHPELLRNAAGEVVGAVNMLVDITDRKRSEEELRERSEQIARLAQQLEAADRRKNVFLATLAHELRNPLAPIRHALQLLHLGEDDPQIQQQARGVIERQLGQMVRLIDDLLDVSRITNNKLQLRKERIELAAAVHSALETARPLIEQAGHELTVLFPADPVYVDADLTRLAQVFINLLNNATKYTERGGRIRLAVERQGGEVAVSVRDTGIGISAEHLPHLFEMFSQALPTLERSGGGLGVGLALARGVVELHGGSIAAHSEGPGQGSEFIVRLPVAEAPAPTEPRLSAGRQARPGPQCRVLIADDNRDSAESLSLLLELSGHETWTAHDGREAVEAASTHLPAVAFLDIGMPEIDGYEVARRIREQPWGESMLLVAITGWGQEDDKQRAREAGFDHHLTKPVNLADLERLLATARDRKPETS